MLVQVRDPKTRELVTQWDDTEPDCKPYEYGSLCGGCVRCMEMQANYAGYLVERPAEFTCIKWLWWCVVTSPERMTEWYHWCRWKLPKIFHKLSELFVRRN